MATAAQITQATDRWLEEAKTTAPAVVGHLLRSKLRFVRLQIRDRRSDAWALGVAEGRIEVAIAALDAS